MDDARPVQSTTHVRNHFSGRAATVVQGNQVTFHAADAAKRLSVDVTTTRATIECESDRAEFLAARIEDERSRLTSLADAYDWSRNRRTDHLPGTESTGRSTFPDIRSRQVYDRHVDDYLEQTREVLDERWFLLQEAHLLAGVEVQLSFDGPVEGFPDWFKDGLPNEWPDLPPVPAPPGTRGDFLAQRLAMAAPRRVLPARRADSGAALPDGWRADDLDDGVAIRFDPVDLRPRQHTRLPAVPLLVYAEAGDALRGRWSATADDADGRCSGDLLLGTVPSTLDLAKAAEPGPPRPNNVSALDVMGLACELIAAVQAGRAQRS